MPRQKTNSGSDDMRRMVHEHLRTRPISASASLGLHLDEDALSVFVEGRLSESEASPIVNHLVGCGSCRKITADLIRLDTELFGVAPQPKDEPDEPGRIRRMLADLGSRVFPSGSDDAVFAYHAPADDFEKKDEPEVGEATDVTDKNGAGSGD